MAFKLKGMQFGEGTGYKSPQAMKKESAMKKVDDKNKTVKSERTLNLWDHMKGAAGMGLPDRMSGTRDGKEIWSTDDIKQKPGESRSEYIARQKRFMAGKHAKQVIRKFGEHSKKMMTKEGRQEILDSKKSPNKKVDDKKMAKIAMTRKMGERTPKSRATNRKPQSQMTDAELAEVKGISKPQSVKPTPPRRRYGDSPNNMAKKSAMKKKSGSKKIFRKRKLTHGLEGNIKQVRNPLTGNVRTTRKVKNPLTGKTRKTVVTSKRGVKKDFEK